MIQTELSNKRFTLKQGDQTWSNNFYSCALGGFEIAQKQFKKILRDKYNHLNSQLKTVNTLKLDKTRNPSN